MTNSGSHTVRSITAFIKEQLSDLYPAEERSAIGRLLLEEYTGMSRAEILSCPLQPLASSEVQGIEQALLRLLNHEPIQYILGKSWFYGLDFSVNKNVLIPRPETEEMVSLALEILKRKKQPVSFLVAGTGSGCIAVTLGKMLPRVAAYAFDKSLGALETAKQNSKKHDAKVHFFHDDMLNFSGIQPTEKVSMLISNPPYVLPREQSAMRKNVTLWEPEAALYAPQDDPLLFYKAFKYIAVQHVANNGVLLLEINEALGREMLLLFDGHPFTACEVLRDMQGKERFFRCRKQN